MTSAIVTRATKGNMQRCHDLLCSLDQHRSLSDGIDRLVLCDVGTPRIDFATLVPIVYDYLDLSTDPICQESFSKAFTLLLPYDHLVYFDPTLLCGGNVSILWSERFQDLLLYACPPENGIFNDYLLVFNPNCQPGFHDTILYYARSHTFDCLGNNFKANLNGYFILTKKKVGRIPYLPIIEDRLS